MEGRGKGVLKIKSEPFIERKKTITYVTYFSNREIVARSGRSSTRQKLV